MSREIAFRVWSESDKEYRADMLSNLTPPFITADYNDEGDRFEIEQYTGLKDKNGEEIYENCELDGRYIVKYIAPKFVCKDIINSDIIELYDNKFTITKEHCEISQNSERGIN